MQYTQNKDYWLLCLSLHRISFLKLEEKKNLLKKLDSSYSLALLSIEEIGNLVGHEIKRHADWDGHENLHGAQIALYHCERLGIKILLCEDAAYPELLRQISDPPFLLFCRGNEKILCERSVSVVGTRRLTQQGKVSAKLFAYDAVVHGVNVISGLANGADGFAHQGALDAFYDAQEKNLDVSKIGRTVAVLPCAIDEILPVSHKRMAAQILETGGCLISEYEPGAEMAKWHFVGRNRIIAGLSPGTVVIEAPAGSGALITADFALEYNRDVMFHISAFCDPAKSISGIIRNQLEKDYSDGRVSKYKVENMPEKFLEAGAPIIKDFNEYCVALGSLETFQAVNTQIQGTLF